MRNIIISFSLILSSLIISCNEEVSLKSALDEEFVLNCILSADTNYQVAYLSKSFEFEGFDPSVYDGDPFVKNAQINIFDNNNVYNFREGTIDSLPGFNFGHPITIYYHDNYTPTVRANISIDVLIPGGKRISATQSTVPQKFTYIPVSRSPIPSADTSKKEILFKLNNNISEVYFVPKLDLTYKSAQDFELKRLEVPYDYVPTSDGLTPVYPAVSKFLDFVYDRRIMDITMRKISEGDDFKSRYQIKQAELKLLFLNDDLAAYYSGTKYVQDNYSISVTLPEYSNVNGGRGIFASFSSVTGIVRLNQKYVQSFGYTYQ